MRASDQLNRAGFLPEYIAGLLVIIGNPKAILFYIGVMPGFFDVTCVTTLDILVVGLVLASVPFCGNVILAVMLDRASLLIASQNARRRLNIVTGVVLFILVGLILIMCRWRRRGLHGGGFCWFCFRFLSVFTPSGDHTGTGNQDHAEPAIGRWPAIKNHLAPDGRK